MKNQENIARGAVDGAQKDAEILERKISELVEEFESKHFPFQVNVMTRYRPFGDLYNLKKGGAAQIKLHDCSLFGSSLPITIKSEYLVKEKISVVYTDPEE